MKDTFNKVYLEYKDSKGNIYDDLVFAVADLKYIKKFEIEKFYECLNNVIFKLSENRLFQIIRILPTNKPEYLFGVLYYHLKDIDTDNSLSREFEYLKQFADCKVDIFMIVNYLRDYRGNVNNA